MAFEQQVIRRATQRLTQLREEREREYDRRRQVIYNRFPRVQVIDKQLRSTVAIAAATAMRKGTDVQQAIRTIGQKNLTLQQERRDILVSNGYPEDYLKEKPACPHCNDSGWVGAAMCQCLKNLCVEEQNKLLSSLLDLKGQSFERFQLDYYPLADRPIMNVVLQNCKRFAYEFGTSSPRNLLLYGPPGVGKTFLSASIARVVSQRGFSVVYDTAIQIFYQFEMDKFTHDPAAMENAKRYLTCDLLILDDLGSEFISPMVKSSLYQLVNARLVANRSTVISTNLTLGDITSRYSQQVASRLHGEYHWLLCQGTDIRQNPEMHRKRKEISP